MNNSNGELFLDKIFRNLFLKDKIFSFIHRERVNYSYNGTIKFELMIKNRKYEMLIDKLKRNENIEISRNSFQDFLSNHLNHYPYFDEIFDLLWLKYNDIIRYLNPLIILLFQKDSTELFKKIYNNYYKKEEESINKTYRLYGLLESILSSTEYNYDNNKIPQYILELIYNSNSQKEEESDNGDNRKYKKIKSGSLSICQEIVNQSEQDDFKLLLDRIYNDKEIPILMPHNIENIFSSINDKIKLLKELNLNFVDLIKTLPNITNLRTFGHNFSFSNESLEFYQNLLLYCPNISKIDYDFEYIDNVKFLKFTIISRIKKYKSVKWSDFQEFYEKKLSAIESTDQLITEIKKKYKMDLEDLFYCFHIHLINNLLKFQQYEQIETILKSNYSFKNFDDPGFNQNTMLVFNSIYFLIDYSLVNFDIQSFNLFLEYSKTIRSMSYKRENIFNCLERNNNESLKEKIERIKLYIEHFYSNHQYFKSLFFLE